jgi:hypothetical protein
MRRTARAQVCGERVRAGRREREMEREREREAERERERSMGRELLDSQHRCEVLSMQLAHAAAKAREACDRCLALEVCVHVRICIHA